MFSHAWIVSRSAELVHEVILVDGDLVDVVAQRPKQIVEDMACGSNGREVPMFVPDPLDAGPLESVDEEIRNVRHALDATPHGRRVSRD